MLLASALRSIFPSRNIRRRTRRQFAFGWDPSGIQLPPKILPASLVVNFDEPVDFAHHALRFGTTEAVAQVQFEATGGPAVISHLELDNFAAQPGVDTHTITSLKLKKLSGQVVANFAHPAGDDSTWVNTAAFTVPAGTTDYVIEVTTGTLASGNASGNPILLGIVGDPSYGAVIASVNGTPLAPNSGQPDGAIVIGSTVGEENQDAVSYNFALIVASEITNVQATGPLLGCLSDGVNQTLSTFSYTASASGKITADEVQFVLCTNGIIDTTSFKVGNSSGYTAQGLYVTDANDVLLTGTVNGSQVGMIKIHFALTGTSVNTTALAGKSQSLSLKGKISLNPDECITTVLTGFETAGFVWHDQYGTTIIGVDNGAIGCYSVDTIVVGQLLVGINIRPRRPRC